MKLYSFLGAVRRGLSHLLRTMPNRHVFMEPNWIFRKRQYTLLVGFMKNYCRLLKMPRHVSNGRPFDSGYQRALPAVAVLVGEEGEQVVLQCRFVLLVSNLFVYLGDLEVIQNAIGKHVTDQYLVVFTFFLPYPFNYNLSISLKLLVCELPFCFPNLYVIFSFICRDSLLPQFHN